jgi:hypothetical protein
MIEDSVRAARCSSGGQIHLEVDCEPAVLGILRLPRLFFWASAAFQELSKTKAPPKCKFFLWTVLLGRIWTASRRASHGLQEDDACTLCSQSSETPAHLLASCFYNREFWFLVLRRHGMLHVLPSANVVEFVDWWLPARKRTPKAFRKNFDTILLLVCWLIWLQRNTRIFGGAPKLHPPLGRQLVTSCSPTLPSSSRGRVVYPACSGCITV